MGWMKSARPYLRHLLAATLLLASIPLSAADSLHASSHGLLTQLQGFMRSQGAQAEDLTAKEAVQLMVDWYRFNATKIGVAGADDALVFRYGGWSEGCATAFNLSLLRRVKNAGEADGVAGITLMFEPSSQVELVPYSSSTAEQKSLEDFLKAVEASPAFRLLGDAKPMSVLLESGGLR